MSDRDDIRRLAQILDRFMVEMLNSLTQPDSLHLQALDQLHDELHEFLAERRPPK